MCAFDIENFAFSVSGVGNYFLGELAISMAEKQVSHSDNGKVPFCIFFREARYFSPPPPSPLFFMFVINH